MRVKRKSSTIITNFKLIKNSNSTAMPSTSIPSPAPAAAEVEFLKKQLKDSEMAIGELKSMIEKLSIENAMLKTCVDTQSISSDVQL